MKSYGRKKHGKACPCCIRGSADRDKIVNNKSRARRKGKEEVKNEIRDLNKR